MKEKHLCMCVKILFTLIVLLIIGEFSEFVAGLSCKRNLFDYNMMDFLDVFVSAFVGFATLYLGLVANKQNETMNRIEENREKRSKSCDVALQRYKKGMGNTIRLSNNLGTYKESKELYVKMSVENCGEAMLQKIKLDFGEDKFESYLAISRNKEKKVKIPIPERYVDENTVKITFISSYKEETYGDFKISIDNNGERYIKHYHYYADDKSKFEKSGE